MNTPGESGKRSYQDLGGSFTPLYHRLQQFGIAERITHVGKIGPRGRSADFVVDDPGAFVSDIRTTGRFCEDTPAGRILHRKKDCWREGVKQSSLHVAVGGDGHVTAHLDRYSPVAKAGVIGECRYSAGRVLVHNAARLAGDLVRLVFGHRVDCAPLLLSVRGRGGSLDAGRTPPEPAEPIPFGTIDEAIDALDRPDEPWSIHWEVLLPGPLDPDRLARAARAAAASHPLARARKARGPVGRPAWSIAPVLDRLVPEVVDCEAESDLGRLRSRFYSQSVPLTGPPFRLIAARLPDGDVLMLNVNHVAADCFGAQRLLRSISQHYAGRPDRPVRSDPVEARHAVAAGLPKDRAARAARLRVLARKLADLVAVPVHVAPDGAEEAPGYGIHVCRIPVQVDLDARDGSAINEILIAALHLTVALWNIEHGLRCGRVSVLMPVNLRPAGWSDEVFANLSVLARTVSSPADRSLDRIRLTVRDQISEMATDRSLPALLDLAGQDSRLPDRVRKALPAFVAATGNRLVDTAALAYVGRARGLNFGAGTAGDSAAWFSPPARMPLGISVGAVAVGQGLNLAFRYRHALLDEHAARRFAEHYEALLQMLCDVELQNDTETGAVGPGEERIRG